MGSHISKEIFSKQLSTNVPVGIMIVIIESFVLNIYMILRVARARKKYAVPIPKMYSDTSEEFNCIQRSHQNYLESIPFFLTFLTLSGMQFPVISTVFGHIFIFGRLLYALGYNAEDPKQRLVGFRFSIFGGLLPLVGTTCVLATGILKQRFLR